MTAWTEMIPFAVFRSDVVRLAPRVSNTTDTVATINEHDEDPRSVWIVENDAPTDYRVLFGSNNSFRVVY